MNARRPRVAHVVETFLARTETFIYTTLRALREVEAHVICRRRINADEFPFDRVHVLPRPRARRRPAR